ncbi:MAG TPA: hypothetical protein VGD37_24595 [Kofleriaceae bacterium]|jgi:hypothetical protein
MTDEDLKVLAYHLRELHADLIGIRRDLQALSRSQPRPRARRCGWSTMRSRCSPPDDVDPSVAASKLAAVASTVHAAYQIAAEMLAVVSPEDSEDVPSE